VPPKTAMLCVFAPAGAIGSGALLQQLLISVWPGVQTLTVSGVSADSYFAAGALAALCFWVGLMIKRSAPARWTLVASLLFPLLWLILFRFAVYPPARGVSPIRVVYTAIALAPLLGLVLAYVLPARQRLERP
jgi:hypothetical protein